MRRALAAAVALALLAAATSGGRSAKPTRDLLPDLVQAPPSHVTVDLMRSGDEVTFRLGFASSFSNQGPGPLEVVAHRDGDVMPAAQVIHRSDGSRRTRPGAGTFHYAAQPTHGHWHLRHFDRYRLTTPAGGRLAAPSRKMGFCLGDDVRAEDARRGPDEPHYVDHCVDAGPGATSFRQGLSIGWADAYRAYVYDQYLDITNVKPGRYVLLNHVNADHAVAETSYRNNAASVLVDLRWPDGRDHFPTLRVVKRCPHRARCSV